jgi:hypothetical protein
MPVNLIPEDSLRAALRPYRVAPETFEAGVRARLEAAATKPPIERLKGLPPGLRNAAALLPLEIFTGSKATGIAAQMVPAMGGHKLLAYLTFPAVSLFVLLGASIFSFAKIHDIQRGQSLAPLDDPKTGTAVGQWWRRHRWGAALVYAATFGLSLIGATWLMFLLYIISFGVLLYVLSSLARLGVGNRLVIAQSCLWGLILLGQLAAQPWSGKQEIHFVDQGLISAVFYAGDALFFAILLGGLIAMLAARRIPLKVPRRHVLILTMISVSLAVVAVALMGSQVVEWADPIVRPATPERIKRYVESFDQAEFSSASWHPWEIVARWAVESKLDPDLSGARRLLDREIAGEQNPFILGSAFRVGLVRTDDISRLKDYEEDRRDLVADPIFRRREPGAISSLEQRDWVIRAALLRNELSPRERDILAQRLHASFNALTENTHEVVLDALRVTQLLEAIDRPVNPDQYRVRVHDWLRRYHSTRAEGFDFAGGFRKLLEVESGDVETTAHAVELMATYGIPKGLNLNWVRSYLRPDSRRRSPDKWIAAVTLDRLNHLPGVTHPSWLAILYHERSLIAAMVLVGLCLYATLSSPPPPDAKFSAPGDFE